MGLIKSLKKSMIRVRHRKGHGVHSPYIYNIVREVFMRKRDQAGSSDEVQGQIYKAMIEARVQQKIADDIAHLCSYAGYKAISIDGVKESGTQQQEEMVICTDSYPIEKTLQAVQEANEKGATVAIIRSANDTAREQIEVQMLQQHKSTTVDKRAYMLIFNNHLPKQHFIL